MSTHHGQFVWYELMTSDLDAAEAFYAPLMGWCLQDAGMPGFRYSIAGTAHGGIGGLMALDDVSRSQGIAPCWTGYVGVDDVDASARHLVEAGGAVHKAPDDIPGVGRFAVVADPQGAVFVLFKGSGSDEPPAVPPGTTGQVGWHELMAADGAAAFDFYAGQFGWRRTDAVDMGPLGTYQLWAGAGTTAGGMMTKPAEMPTACWQYYFNVAGIDAAVAQVAAGGGRVLMGPHQVPGGSWIANCLDPQGAAFSLVAPVR
ncbi:MAG: glyoxalase [Burkholderiales bacterium PBB5]|nr:MAG: glyoxalase [Burkholderiales bacterium PBB5]